MKILLTGCAGFIGSNLLEILLNSNYQVIGIDNFDNFYSPEIKRKNLSKSISHKNFTFIEGNIIDIPLLENIFKKHSIECVIHLAAKAGVRPSIKNPFDYYKTNILGTINILELMKIYKVDKIIFASSSSVYGNKSRLPFKETDITDFPISPYAATKKACEEIIFTYHKLFDFSAFCFRFFTVYGPRQRPDMAIAKFTDSIYKRKVITLFAKGESERDYTYIDDITYCLLNAVEKIYAGKYYEIINLGNSKPIKLVNLVHKLENLIGIKAIYKLYGSQPGDVERTCADINKAKKLLKYNPKTNIDDGLLNYIKWYKEVNCD